MSRRQAWLDSEALHLTMLSTSIPSAPEMKSSPLLHLCALAALLRPGHWVKNLVCLLPAFSAGLSLHQETLAAIAISIAAFCLAASCIYIFNDLADLKRDRLHPRKKERPLASGKISPTEAACVAAAALAASICLAWQVSAALAGIIGTYFTLNVACSLWLKKSRSWM